MQALFNHVKNPEIENFSTVRLVGPESFTNHDSRQKYHRVSVGDRRRVCEFARSRARTQPDNSPIISLTEQHVLHAFLHKTGGRLRQIRSQPHRTGTRKFTSMHCVNCSTHFICFRKCAFSAVHCCESELADAQPSEHQRRTMFQTYKEKCRQPAEVTKGSI